MNTQEQRFCPCLLELFFPPQMMSHMKFVLRLAHGYSHSVFPSFDTPVAKVNLDPNYKLFTSDSETYWWWSAVYLLTNGNVNEFGKNSKACKSK